MPSPIDVILNENPVPIRTHPYSVVLFDEIEKVHPKVLAHCTKVIENVSGARGSAARWVIRTQPN